MSPKLYTFLTWEGWVQSDSNSYQLGFIFKTECDIYQIYGTNVHTQICLRLVVSLAFQNLYAAITKSFKGKKPHNSPKWTNCICLVLIFMMLSRTNMKIVFFMVFKGVWLSQEWFTNTWSFFFCQANLICLFQNFNLLALSGFYNKWCCILYTIYKMTESLNRKISSSA